MARKIISNRNSETIGDKSTILLDKEVIELLKEAKDHPRQTYTELLRKMTTLYLSAKENIRASESEKMILRDKEIQEHIGKDISGQ